MHNCTDKIALGQKLVTSVVVCGGIVRIDIDGLLVQFDRLGKISLEFKCVTQVEVGGDIVRIDFYGLLVQIDRTDQIALEC